MNKLFVVEKVRGLPETNSSSAHTYYLGGNKIDKINKVKSKLIKFLDKNNNKLVLHPAGETQFGWECYVYNDWESLYNWLIIPAYRFYYHEDDTVNNKKIMGNLINKIKEFTGIENIDIYTFNEYDEELNDNNWSYVDHQSVDIPIDYILDQNVDLGEILTGELHTDNDNSPCGDNYHWL